MRPSRFAALPVVLTLAAAALLPGCPARAQSYEEQLKEVRDVLQPLQDLRNAARRQLRGRPIAEVERAMRADAQVQAAWDRYDAARLKLDRNEHGHLPAVTLKDVEADPGKYAGRAVRFEDCTLEAVDPRSTRPFGTVTLRDGKFVLTPPEEPRVALAFRDREGRPCRAGFVTRDAARGLARCARGESFDVLQAVVVPLAGDSDAAFALVCEPVRTHVSDDAERARPKVTPPAGPPIKPLPPKPASK